MFAAVMLAAILTGPVVPPATLRPPPANGVLGPVYIVDQLRCPAPPQEFTPRLRGLNTLEEADALLRANGFACTRFRVYLDTNTTDPKLVAAINNLPPGQLFAIPQKQTLMINSIVGRR